MDLSKPLIFSEPQLKMVYNNTSLGPQRLCSLPSPQDSYTTSDSFPRYKSTFVSLTEQKVEVHGPLELGIPKRRQVPEELVEISGPVYA